MSVVLAGLLTSKDIKKQIIMIPKTGTHAAVAGTLCLYLFLTVWVSFSQAAQQPDLILRGFNKPFGVAIDPNTDDLYVADTGNNRVLRFTNRTALTSCKAESCMEFALIIVDFREDVGVSEHSVVILVGNPEGIVLGIISDEAGSIKSNQFVDRNCKIDTHTFPS